MNQAIFMLVAVAFLASCNSGSSNNKQPAKSQEELVKDATDKIQNSPSAPDLSQDVKPETMQIVKTNLTYDELKKFRTVGCDANGNSVSQLDPELSVGQSFRRQTGSSKTGKNTSLSIVLEEIVLKTTSQLKTNENFELLENSAAPGVRIEDLFSGKPHTIGEITLNEAGHPTAYNYSVPNVTPAGIQYYQTIYPEQELGWYCYVKYSATGYNQTRSSDEITYQIMGTTASGYIDRTKTTGVIECAISSNSETESTPDKDVKIELGVGTEETQSIYSNSIVSDSFVRCGGNPVYSSSRIILKTGRVVYSNVEKILFAPLRVHGN